MLTIGALAEELAVEPGDVAALAGQLMDLPSEELSDDVAADLRLQLSPNGEGTVLDVYWPDQEQD